MYIEKLDVTDAFHDSFVDVYGGVYYTLQLPIIPLSVYRASLGDSGQNQCNVVSDHKKKILFI